MKFFWWNKKISIIQAAISVKNILIYLYSICKVLVWRTTKHVVYYKYPSFDEDKFMYCEPIYVVFE